MNAHHFESDELRAIAGLVDNLEDTSRDYLRLTVQVDDLDGDPLGRILIVDDFYAFVTAGQVVDQ